MPLYVLYCSCATLTSDRHLLSKKSWNVYSPANRARVARDEALAAAAQRDQDTHQKDVQSASILDSLRNRDDQADSAALQTLNQPHGKKRKRIPGEDDTERDLRHAREHADQLNDDANTRLVKFKPRDDQNSSIVDKRGNINLFPKADSQSTGSHGESHLKKEIDRQKAAEGYSAMRLSDAAGRTKRDPWYLQSNQPSTQVHDQVKADMKRLDRNTHRKAAADPLATMKRAQSQLREARREKEEQEKDLQMMRQHERSKERKLDRFSLDSIASDQNRTTSQRRHHRDTKHRQRRRERHHQKHTPEETPR
jgi:hypothetical protein